MFDVHYLTKSSKKINSVRNFFIPIVWVLHIENQHANEFSSVSKRFIGANLEISKSQKSNFEKVKVKGEICFLF